MLTSLPPFIVFFTGALLAAPTHGAVRKGILIGTPMVGAIMLLNATHDSAMQVEILDYTLTVHRVDKLSLLFGYVFHIAALIGVIYALHVRDTIQHVAALLYAGSALGTVFAGDLITLFVFWELLAVSSVFLIWARRTERAYRAGFRYLIIQVLSGVILMAGAVLHYYSTGSLAFERFDLQHTGSWLILLAFGIKCAFPFLHNWLTDAYPKPLLRARCFSARLPPRWPCMHSRAAFQAPSC